MTKTLGYVRVSSIEQNTARQLEQLQHCDYIYTDKLSGKDTNRPELTRLLSEAQSYDTILVSSIDRLSRTIVDLRTIVDSLVARNITISFIKENLTFSRGEDNPMATALLGMLGVFAELERSMIRSRQKEGYACKRERGELKLSSEQLAKLHQLASEGISKVAIAKQLGIARNTVYYFLKKGLL